MLFYFSFCLYSTDTGTVNTLDQSGFSVYAYVNIPCIIIFKCVHMLISVVFPFIRLHMTYVFRGSLWFVFQFMVLIYIFCLLFCFKFFKCFQLLALYFASDGTEITSLEYPVEANSSLRLERKRLRESFYLLICLPKDFPPNAGRRRKASL